MPPWELRGGRAYNLICHRGISFSKVDGLQRLLVQAASRKSVRTASYSASTAGYATQATEPISLRKQLKDEAKAKRSAVSNGISKPSVESKRRLKDWELTVGIEIHAQLNTARKLFSRKHLVYCGFEANSRQMRPLLSMQNQIVTSPSSISQHLVRCRYFRKPR
jgi:hypothetical protein